MTSTETALLTVLAVLMIIYFLMCIVAVVFALRLLTSLNRVAEKAEGVVDSVESATEVFMDTQGRWALFKLVRNIVKSVQRSHKK